MNVQYKDAAITNLDDDFPGTFEVVLSTPTLDRDGDILKSEEWQQPLPERITFDSDHGMSVATTVGSGVPRIDEKSGNLIVAGEYSSLERAQEVRTLVKEGHISKTSVAYLTKRTKAAGGRSASVKRELLNGAFVAVPANNDAVVLSSKSGARNSKDDATKIQQIHDLALELGASGVSPDDSDSPAGKSLRMKAVAGSFEQNQQAVSDALSAVYTGDSVWAYPVATFPDTVVYRVSGDADAGQWQASYTLNDDGTATLGIPERVSLVEQILTGSKGLPGRKDVDNENKTDPAVLIQATDAAIDEAIDLFASVDITTLPAEVQQAIALVQAADTAVDELMEVVGIPDPDEEDASSSAGASDAPAAGAKAPAAGTVEAPTQAEQEDLQLKAMQMRIRAVQAIAGASTTPKGNAP